jgi:hypothetical protein
MQRVEKNVLNYLFIFFVRLNKTNEQIGEDLLLGYSRVVQRSHPGRQIWNGTNMTH